MEEERCWFDGHGLLNEESHFWLTSDEGVEMRRLERRARTLILTQLVALVLLAACVVRFCGESTPWLPSAIAAAYSAVMLLVDQHIFRSLPVKRQCWLIGHTPTVISCDRCGEPTGDPGGFSA